MAMSQPHLEGQDLRPGPFGGTKGVISFGLHFM